MPQQVLGNKWFKKNQSILLWFCNTPIIKYWFRWLLRIHKDCSFKERIIEITPNSYKVDLGIMWTKKHGIRQTIRIDIRTHNKFSKRIYYAFYPIWWMAHQWDMLIANQFQPSWNLGFDTLTAFPDAGSGATTVDGEVARLGAVSETWATIRAGAGNFNRTAGFGTGQCYAFYFVADSAGDWDSLLRYIATFDTSSMGAGATVSTATLSLKGQAKLDPASNTPDCNIYGATPVANNTLADADYGQVGTTAFSTAVAYASLSTSAYVDWVLNASGLANISVTGISRFAAKNDNKDAANVEPAESTNETSWTIESADFTGTSSDPKLVVTYTPAPVGGFFTAFVQGLT